MKSFYRWLIWLFLPAQAKTGSFAIRVTWPFSLFFCFDECRQHFRFRWSANRRIVQWKKVRYLQLVFVITFEHLNCFGQMTPRWISECKGFQMSQNFFDLDHFEILSVHPNTAVMAKKNRRFCRGREIAVNGRRKKKFKMAAKAIAGNPRKQQFCICDCSWKRKGNRLKQKGDKPLTL